MVRDYSSLTQTPINTAGHPNVFLFPQASRFSETHRSACNKTCYDKREPLSARTPSFGIGQRTSLALKTKTPAPSAYDLTSPPKSCRGHSFAQKKRVSFVDEQSRHLAKNPAPTKYHREAIEKSRSYLFGARSQEHHQPYKQKLGPGSYNLTGLITRKGYYPISTNKGSKCSKMGREKRFGSDSTPVPGPGQYRDQLGLDLKGEYFNSRIQSKGVRSFGKPGLRNLFRGEQNPGPGTYFHFSQFQAFKK